MYKSLNEIYKNISESVAGKLAKYVAIPVMAFYFAVNSPTAIDSRYSENLANQRPVSVYQQNENSSILLAETKRFRNKYEFYIWKFGWHEPKKRVKRYFHDKETEKRIKLKREHYRRSRSIMH